MNKLTSMMLGAACTLLLGATGCGGTCSTYCDLFVQDCGAEVTVGLYTGGIGYYASGCNWDDEEDIADRCSESCDKAMEGLSDSETEDVDLCMECIDEELQGECTDGEDLWNAILDDCENDCDEDGVGEFLFDSSGGFFDELDVDEGDIDC